MSISSHGSLEKEIMNAVWTMEENSNNIQFIEISVGDVVNFINSNNSAPKAYTTVKTVMDRLTDKKYLERIKSGKKFCYKSIYSRNERIKLEIKNMAIQYFNNDIKSLMKVIEKECLIK
ncbi:BlaI/MecI/CopY family transcriptional regulator [bacterium]|nr:BlaI/MecI/CopY family transcriptional regulator [bacterium]